MKLNQLAKNTLISTFVLVGCTATASFAESVNCENVAIEEAYRTYKGECGGFGAKDACFVKSNATTHEGTQIKVVCSFSGEPDYTDRLDIELMYFDVYYDQTCLLVKRTINECFND